MSGSRRHDTNEVKGWCVPFWIRGLASRETEAHCEERAEIPAMQIKRPPAR